MTNFVHANISSVTTRLWTGGDFETTRPPVAARQIEEARGAGLTHVIDLRAEWSDASFLEAHGVDYLWLGIPDAGQAIADGWWTRATSAVNAAMSEPGHRVLVHCHMGINRGPSLAFAVLLSRGWDAVDALTRIRAARPVAYMAYAEGALDWHFRRNAAEGDERAAVLRRTDAWRAENPLRLTRVIRQEARRWTTPVNYDADSA